MFGIGYKQARVSSGECYLHRIPGKLYLSVSTFWLLLLDVSSKGGCTFGAGLKQGKVQHVAHIIAGL